MSLFSPDVEIYETSKKGNKLSRIEPANRKRNSVTVTLLPNQRYQTISGFGGSFTEASAYLLSKLSKKNRKSILEAYFGEDGARYSLTRTHINSCDFALENYSYASVAGDKELRHFSVERDKRWIFPMIKLAMELSENGFKIIASPWTAPPWMKDNNGWCGGKLLPEYYSAWALYFSKYLTACKSEGIELWGITVENEPLGNNSNWESMHYTPDEMNHFVKDFLIPQLTKDGHSVKILGYDQNRGPELKEWVDVMYADKESGSLYDGTAVHWYESTTEVFERELQYAHNVAPNKHLIQTEACIDAEIPRWKNDDWYWTKEATDWGWDWAPANRKHLHPKYVPAFRYARDIIGCLNNYVDGWIDWNMVLDRRGGPNWAKNWCIAPVIVDTDLDEIYFTPLYSILSHFSRFIKPGAIRIGYEINTKELITTGVKNPDGTLVLILLNQNTSPTGIDLILDGNKTSFEIQGKAIQTVVLPSNE
jgi:glucosylceramidase